MARDSHIRFGLTGGTNTAKAERDMSPGELTQSTGIYYRPGDQRAHVIGGRTLFGDTGTAAKVKGCALCLFDAGGTDYLVALSGTKLYAATPGLSGTFSELATGLDAASPGLCVAHSNDRHYIATGLDRNRVLKSDGTVRLHGMLAPTELITVEVDAVSATTVRPTAATTSNPGYALLGNAYDPTPSSYSAATMSGPGSMTATWSTFTPNAGLNRKLMIDWSVASGAIPRGRTAPSRFGDTGARAAGGFDVTVLIELHNGTSWSTIHSETFRGYQENVITQIGITDSVQVSGYSVRATFTYNSGRAQASHRVHDIRIVTGSAASNFSTTVGFNYAVAEVDWDDGIMGPVGQPSALVEMSAKNQALITLPSAARNTNATHWAVFRTFDGGTVPQDFGLVGYTPIASTTYLDDFIEWPASDQPYPLYPMLLVSDPRGGDVNPLYYHRDNAPPAFSRIRPYRGSLIGMSDDEPRTLRYSVPGLDDSWPEVYVFPSFPLEEHDELLDCCQLGDSLLVVASAAVLRVEDLPRSISGQFNAGPVTQLPGAEGGVGRLCLTRYTSTRGESKAAWISHHGIYTSNGNGFDRISDNIDWESIRGYNKSKWLLRWDSRRLCLVFAYSATNGGENDRYYLIHMADEGAPRWTGPHYGKIAELTGGMVAHKHRLYSAHNVNGGVYMENNGEGDASQSYGGTANPVIAATGKLYTSDYNEYSMLGATLFHDDFGVSQECTVSITTGRDTSNYSSTVQKTVKLAGSRGTPFDIGRGGEWHKVTVEYTGNKIGAFGDLVIDVRSLSPAGKVSVG